MQQEVERRREDIDRIILQAENSHFLQAEDGVNATEEDSTYQVKDGSSRCHVFLSPR